jgi:hypothetical protein
VKPLGAVDVKALRREPEREPPHVRAARKGNSDFASVERARAAAAVVVARERRESDARSIEERRAAAKRAIAEWSAQNEPTPIERALALLGRVQARAPSEHAELVREQLGALVAAGYLELRADAHYWTPSGLRAMATALEKSP